MQRTRENLDREQAERPGCRALRRANRTRTLVGLYHNKEAKLDDEGGPYSTVCEVHGTVIAHETLKLATHHLSYPDQWCEDCAEAIKGTRTEKR